MQLDHFRNPPHGLGEALQPDLVVLGGFHRDIGGKAEIDRRAVSKGHPGADDAVLLQLLDPPPAGGGREPDRIGDLTNRGG